MDDANAFVPPDVGDDSHIIRRLGWAVVRQWLLPEVHTPQQLAAVFSEKLRRRSCSVFELDFNPSAASNFCTRSALGQELEGSDLCPAFEATPGRDKLGILVNREGGDVHIPIIASRVPRVVDGIDAVEAITGDVR